MACFCTIVGGKELIKRVIRSYQNFDVFINEDENIKVLCSTL